MVLLAELVADLEQLARHSAEKVKQLAADMAANGMHQAVGAGEDKRLIYGHGRFAAAKLLGWKEIETKVYLGTLTPTQLLIIRAAENLHRADWNGFQKWKLCEELLQQNPSWTQKDLADHLSFDGGSISNFLSPAKCCLAVQQALRAGLLTTADCVRLSRLDEPCQQHLLAATLNGAGAAEIKRQARKARSGPSDAQKVSRFKGQVSGASVTVVSEGGGLALDDLIETLAELLKEARKANDQGLSAKTFEKALRDKASHD
jgi:ParB-like chromosome segregation protein Spo0J